VRARREVSIFQIEGCGLCVKKWWNKGKVECASSTSFAMCSELLLDVEYFPGHLARWRLSSPGRGKEKTRGLLLTSFSFMICEDAMSGVHRTIIE